MTGLRCSLEDGFGVFAEDTGARDRECPLFGGHRTQDGGDVGNLWDVRMMRLGPDAVSRLREDRNIGSTATPETRLAGW
jgi:hypothetical protein